MRLGKLFVRKFISNTLILNKADYSKTYKLLTPEGTKEENHYPVLLSGYDRSPRAGRKAEILYNFTPEAWRKHVRYTLDHVEGKEPENNCVFLKSWNEWGESNYVEPDLRYGTAFLDILAEELKK